MSDQTHLMQNGALACGRQVAAPAIATTELLVTCPACLKVIAATKPPRIEDVATLADRWADLMPPGLRIGHCVLAARLLTSLWPTSRVVPCNAMAVNRLAQSTYPRNSNDRRRVDEILDGAWGVGAHQQMSSGPGYAGHLLVETPVALPDGDTLTLWVDMTAAQFDRPNRAIRVKRPILIPPSTGAPSVITKGGLQWDLHDIGVGVGFMHYERVSTGKANDWTLGTDWTYGGPSLLEPLLNVWKEIVG